MAQQIALFNHKGGVSKTTTTFNLGWQLASMGKRVLIVDGDPQSNLTGLVLGYRGPSELGDFYTDEPDRNLKSGLAPAFESKPVPIKAIECFPVAGRDGLFLLPGHIGLSEYEVTLGIAQELSGSIQTLQNLPGSIPDLLSKTAQLMEADYLIIDMNPSLSAFNQNLLMTSNFFVVPTTPDYYSVMAINSLAKVIPAWHDWSKKAQSFPVLQNATYPFPSTEPKFLGTIIQNYRPRGGDPARGFQKWIDQINTQVSEGLFPALQRIDMTLPGDAYQRAGMEHYCLASIPDFNSLIAKSQESQTPVWDLTEAQLDQTGVVLQQTRESQANFRAIFSNLADRIIQLTSDEANG